MFHLMMTPFRSVVSHPCKCLTISAALALALALVYPGAAGAWQAYIDGDMDGDPTTVGDHVFGPETIVGDFVVVLDEQDVAELVIEFSLELEWDCVDGPEHPYCIEYHGGATPLENTCRIQAAVVDWAQCLLVGCGCGSHYFIYVQIYNPYMENLGRRLWTPGTYCLQQVEFTRVGRDCGDEEVFDDGVPHAYERTEFRLWRDYPARDLEALFVMEGQGVSTEATSWGTVKSIYRKE